jgi:hypothetical protein
MQSEPRGEGREQSQPGQKRGQAQGQKSEGQPKTTGQGQSQPKAGQSESQQQGPAPARNRDEGQNQRQPENRQGQNPEGQGQRQQGAQQQQQKSGSSTSVTFTTEQRTKIRETVLRGGNAPRLSKVDFSINVGTAVPSHVKVVTVPDVIVEIHPQWRGFLYFVVEDQIIIVDKGHKIVAVLDV